MFQFGPGPEAGFRHRATAMCSQGDASRAPPDIGQAHFVIICTMCLYRGANSRLP